MKSIISAVALLFLVGCGTVQLVDKSGKTHPGKFDSITKQLEGTINGKTYKGLYVTNAGTANISGWAQGPQSTYMTGQVSYSGNVGRAILRSTDGDTIQCEFNYHGYSAIGNCQGTDGERYQLFTQ
jgi:hypothetical protein